MKDVNKNLSEIVDIEYKEVETNSNTTISVETTKREVVPVSEDTTGLTKEATDDLECARDTLKNVMSKGEDLLEGISEIAGEGQEPRSYEVAAELLKSVADATEKLFDLHKKASDIKKNTKGSSTFPGSVNVDKAVFVGTTKELIRHVKEPLKNV